MPRIRFGVRNGCESLDKTPGEKPLNLVIQWKANQYHLIKLDLSEQKYQNDVSKAIEILYSDYRCYLWRTLAFRRIIGVEYVKVIVSVREGVSQ